VPERLLLLRAEARGRPTFWLDVAVKHDGKLKDVDRFLRRIWLECCGHMSEFSTGTHHKVSMKTHMLIQASVAAVILLSFARPGDAQQRPDFSGEWILSRQASTLSPGADAVQSGVVRIEHREATFRYKAAPVTGGKPFEYEFELLSDGREVVSTQQGRQTVAVLRWDGDALAVTWRTQRAEGEMKIVFRYELIDAGRRLRAMEQVRGTDHDQDNVWIFERR
jgi:hypothetical protein